MERRHSASAQPTKSAVPSKTNVPAQKTTSEASLTPSQFAAFEAAKGRKNPLDALSRMSLRQKTLEKRSGLQDVDEEFLKGNVFAKQASNRHSGLNNVNLHNVGAHTKPPAGQPSGLLCNINQSQMNASMQPQVPMNADGTIPAGGAQQQAQFVPSQVMPQQVQQQMQQGQQPQMVPSSPGIQQGQGQQSNMNMGGQGQGGQQMQQVLQQQVPQQLAPQAQMQQQQMPPQQQQQQMAPQAQMQQQMPTQLQQLQQAAQQQQLAMQQVAQQQQQMQQPAAGQPSGQQYVTAGQQQIGQQGYTQPAAGQPSAKGQPIKQNMTSPANTMIPPQVQPEPDMCTTCPNCQTTIYLVRPDINEMQQMQQQAGGVVN